MIGLNSGPVSVTEYWDNSCVLSCLVSLDFYEKDKGEIKKRKRDQGQSPANKGTF